MYCVSTPFSRKTKVEHTFSIDESQAVCCNTKVSKLIDGGHVRIARDTKVFARLVRLLADLLEVWECHELGDDSGMGGVRRGGLYEIGTSQCEEKDHDYTRNHVQ